MLGTCYAHGNNIPGWVSPLVTIGHQVCTVSHLVRVKFRSIQDTRTK